MLRTVLRYAIYRGILTGFNEAFIIDNETKNALVTEDPRSAEIIKPVLRGRDIERFRARWRGLWLIATFPALGLSIDNYPAVKRHLLSIGKPRLEQSGKRLPGGTRSRKKTGNAWFEVQDTCAYHAEFSRPKLLWMDMSPEARFSYSDTEMFCNNKGFLLTGASLRFLCAILNSSVITWFVKRTARTTGMGLVQWEKFAVERVPVPRVSQAEQGPLVELVDSILAAKAADADADTEGRERELDRLVYELYGLIPEEVSAVEESLA